MQPEARLLQLGHKLPPASKPLATYRIAVRSGNFLFVSGMGPMKDGKPVVTGKLGRNVSLKQGYEAAQLACLHALAVARQELGSLAHVRQVVRATIYVASTGDFTQQPAVANGATDLLKEVFGEMGLPARAAVGVNVLPLDIPVEVELQLEVG